MVLLHELRQAYGPCKHIRSHDLCHGDNPCLDSRHTLGIATCVKSGADFQQTERLYLRNQEEEERNTTVSSCDNQWGEKVGGKAEEKFD